MALTKVSGDVIKDSIVVSGIVTATEFPEPSKEDLDSIE